MYDAACRVGRQRAGPSKRLGISLTTAVNALVPPTFAFIDVNMKQRSERSLMTTSLEDRAAQPGAVIYCRIPANVATAASAVAAHEMISLADVASCPGLCIFAVFRCFFVHGPGAGAPKNPFIFKCVIGRSAEI
jgi:hypothetical protein